MSAAKKKVLIVEDEFVLYEELHEFFSEKGFEIIGHQDERAVDNYEDAVKLIETDDPHIAILDISIKGKKDGLELADYIRKHFNSLIIILTANGNYVNIERARTVSADGFVLKIEKPFQKEQLWATVALKLDDLPSKPRKSRGEFFRVREIDVSGRSVKNTNGSKQPVDPVDIETFINWNSITYIESANKMGNNTILIHTESNSKAYFTRNTLTDLEDQLPDHFVRVEQSFIINAHHITAKGRGNFLYFIGEASFRVSEKYRAEALPKINRILGKKG